MNNTELFSPAKRFGELLKNELMKDPHFYLFSPDETTSNKLDAVFETEKRAWNLPTKEWDLPESTSGRVVEMLSENDDKLRGIFPNYLVTAFATNEVLQTMQ